ncbi:hypothetical protein GPJ56_010438 [Histomonas meleagridis]|uniref:uncharacterized protein n=1 Tax=Histomonas meleagridis TaxID=135588 RepID=UPI00355ACD90|nr:hypothetical protein GPJ56_010438 [Histomonas meleagridis]KAH0799003.1 hypothetical protein GO595_008155 [Histomonas meleagridis]
MASVPYGYALPIASTFLGYQLLKCISKRGGLDILGASFPVGMTLTSIISMLSNFIGVTSSFVVAQILGAITLGVIFFMIGRKRTIYLKFPKTITIIILIIYIVLLSYISYIAYGEKGKIISTGLNDCLLEFAYIASFANGTNKHSNFINGVKLPLFSENQAKTEYLPSFYSAMMVVTGSLTEHAVLIQTVLLFSSIVILQYYLTYKISNNEFVSVLSVPVAFLLGGFGFLNFINNTEDRYNANLDFVFNYGKNSYNVWGHPILHCFITSRPALLTFSLSLTVLNLLQSNGLIFSGILVLFCTIVRVQSGFILTIMYLFYFPSTFNLKHLLIKAICIIPTVLYIIYTGFKPKITNQYMFSFQSYSKSLLPPVKFSLSVFGFLFPVLTFSFFNKKLIYRTIISLIIFYLFTFVTLHNEIRYNFFELISTILPLIISLSYSGMISFTKLFKKEHRSIFHTLIFFITFFMCISSIIGIYQKIQQKMPIWDDVDYETAEYIMNNTNETDVFVGASHYGCGWSPAIVIAGRQSFYENSAALHSSLYDNNDHFNRITMFMNTKQGKLNANFFIARKMDEWEGRLNQMIGTIVDVLYANDKYTIYKYV